MARRPVQSKRLSRSALSRSSPVFLRAGKRAGGASQRLFGKRLTLEKSSPKAQTRGANAMNHTEVIRWVVATVASFLRLSQAKTLAVFAAGAPRVAPLCLPATAQGTHGDSLPETAAALPGSGPAEAPGRVLVFLSPTWRPRRRGCRICTVGGWQSGAARPSPLASGPPVQCDPGEPVEGAGDWAVGRVTA